jgi:uncharacterized protein YutE (UPF0331/DUF86 family)
MIENIDVEKIQQKIIFMQDSLHKLRQLQKISQDDFVEDFRNADSAKYLLQVTIEAMLDIANHIIARNRWGKPETNKQTFEILSQQEIISVEDINIFFSMTKFRNRIVHMYFTVDDQVIYEITQHNLEDFSRYIQLISKHL